MAINKNSNAFDSPIRSLFFTKAKDLNDSFDRLTRGAAKLEPEILDELGIIVRIDKAVADYAARVGKGVKELSLWERQQAFVNAMNEN
jgi:hypothetical protein